MFSLRLIIAVSFVLLVAATQAATGASLEQQRQRFLDARAALDDGDNARFEKLASQLKDYPLYPYLVSWQMQSQSNLDKKRVDAFLDGYGDTPFTIPVREQWLHQLAEEGNWQEYITAYRPSSRGELRCNYYYAQLRTGNAQIAWHGARALWLSANRQDGSCNRLFEAWQQAGGLTVALRRQRLDLILQSGNMDLAKQVAASLPESDRHRVALWQQVYRRPATLTSEKQLQRDSADNRELIVFGIQRLARSDPQGAAAAWQQLQNRYHFTDEQRTALLNFLVVRLALNGDISALDWYDQIPAQSIDSDSRQWTIRVALRYQQWRTALATLQTMPTEERNDEEWQYWTARCLEAIGETEPARQLYLGIANNSSYYGFLASDHLNIGYNLSHRPVAVADAALEKLSRDPALVRAYELLQLNLTKEARREWDSTIARLDSAEQLTAGKLADSWSWHDRAALALAKADYFDDLEIRFPLAYTDEVMKEAKANTLDPAWVFAVARQESVMNPEARSPVGALGLMQLMPATGRKIARQLKSALNDLQQLLRPELNIRFGTYYLRELSDQFDDHQALATAAYNAGPNRVRDWAPQQPSMDADIWIDSIPFGETRTYVRRVLAYSVFYDQRLSRDVVRLRERLPAIKQKETSSQCSNCGTLVVSNQ